jgi:pyrroline-5-carboxylate reductase
MKIGIIGYGNMGSAIAGRIKSKYRVLVFDKDRTKTKDLKGIELTSSAQELVENTDVIILAVKPQDFDALLGEIKEYIKGKLVISIAAGIETEYIENTLRDAGVVRAMPNLGAKIGESVTCISRGRLATEKDLTFAEELFNCLGKTRKIEEEKMNAVTAVSGSGPGYIFYFMEVNSLDPVSMTAEVKNDIIEHLERAALGVGFSPEEAKFLAVSTTGSSIRLATMTNIPPAELKKQVASQGGTTEAGLKVLESGGSWEEAAQSALRRAEELSKKKK